MPLRKLPASISTSTSRNGLHLPAACHFYPTQARGLSDADLPTLSNQGWGPGMPGLIQLNCIKNTPRAGLS